MSSPRDVLNSLSGLLLSSSAMHNRARTSRGNSLIGNLSPPPATGPESGESLESKARKGERGFEEMRTLVSLPFFENIDKSAARKLAQYFTRRIFEKGELITHSEPVRPNSPDAAGRAVPSSAAASSAAAAAFPPAAASAAAPVVDEHAFHVLVRGRVEVSAVQNDGKLISLGERSNPSYFGPQALDSHSQSLQRVQVRALEQCIVLSVGASRFEEFIAANPSVRVALHSSTEPAVAASAHAHNTAGSSSPAKFSFARPRSASASGHFFSSSSGSGGHHAHSASSSAAMHSPPAAGSAAAAASSSSAAGASAFPSSWSGASGSSSSSSGGGGGGGGVKLNAEGSKLTVSLRDVPFFSTLLRTIPETTLQHLATLFEFRRCPSAGQVLMREHEPPSGFYVLLEGRVSCSAQAGPPSHSNMHLSTVAAGDQAAWFGEVSLIFKSLRTATITALQPCTLLFLSSANFATFLRLAPEVLRDQTFRSVLHKRVGASLKTVPLFACLRLKEKGPLSQWREDVLGQLGAMFAFKFVGKGKIVCREGEEAGFFAVVHRGTVEVSARGHHQHQHHHYQHQQGEEAAAATAAGTNAAAAAGGGQHHARGGGSSSSGGSGGSSSSGAAAHSSSSSFDFDGTPLDSDGNLILTELSAGDFLGELSMAASNSRRTASVRALTDCVFLLLPRSHFSRFIQLVPQVQHTIDRVSSMRTAQTLGNIPFFRSIRENKPWSKLSILGQKNKERGGGGGKHSECGHEGTSPMCIVRFHRLFVPSLDFLFTFFFYYLFVFFDRFHV